ncbi:MAG: alpha/beta hydrolase family protein, partial [Qipengyuania sp.]
SSFDPAARGWPGIEQDMAANATIYEAGLGLQVDPGADPALYHRNSPLTYVEPVTTPLLLIHGELASRAPLTQPEALYSLLRRRGRIARLLRYWGENHSLANSPANVRDITDELINWFDHFLKHEDGETE